MTEEDIADVIQGFASSALDAKRTSFDGLELHGTHGYLIDQFFWEVTNKQVKIMSKNRYSCNFIYVVAIKITTIQKPSR